jgi:8-oxo-dGTP pyrophosphatase MutT (NUDIX family)
LSEARAPATGPDPVLGGSPAQRRGGPQIIPRPPRTRPGPGAAWSRPGANHPAAITVADVRRAIAARSEPPAQPTEIPGITLPVVPGQARRPAAVLCALFDNDNGQCEVVLTRRSSRLRSHTHQVSFPGGRIDPGERPLDAALREAREEVGIDPATVEVFGELSKLQTVTNPAPITPFVAQLPARPLLRPNPAEVERAFSVQLVELTLPEVYREEVWTFPDGLERPMSFFELVGDTVWGATARMLTELLDLILG